MPATLTKALARGNAGPLLRLLILCLAVLLFCWLASREVEAANIPVRSGSAGRTTWNVETSTLDSVIAATDASVQIGRDIISRIAYGGKQIGTVAAMEVSAIGVADMAAVIARASGPVMIAMLAGDLALRGLQQCASSSTGWCKPGVRNPSQGDPGFNGTGWTSDYGATGDSPVAACRAQYGGQYGASNIGAYQRSPANWACTVPTGTIGSAVQDVRCVSGYIGSSSGCVVDPNYPVTNTPMTYPDIAAAWNAQMASNPDRIKDYWQQMTPEQQAQAEQNAQRQPTQIKGTDTVNDPNVSTKTETNTKPDGTQQQCTTTTGVRVQARPNSGSGAASSPLNYQTSATNTRTCPDGTTTTNTNTDSGDTSGQPASSPSASTQYKGCGLADSGPCKIDESGTPTVADGKAAITAVQSDLTQTRQDAQTNFTTVNQGRSFDLHMPHLLPGGTCQPVEWYSWGSWRGSWDPCDSMAYVRTLLSWLWYTLAAMYIWNRTASANAGAQ